MMYPPMRELLEKVDNRYTLVVETAKRARQLVDGAPALIQTESEKPVSIAIREINEGKIRYEQRYEGIK